MDSNAGLSALTRARDEWNAGNLDGYLRLYRDDAVLHGYPGVGPGIDSIRGFYAGFLTAFPGARLDFEDTFAADDKVVCRFTVAGRHAGPFQGMPPTQRTFTVPGITILRFEGDCCVERWSQTDFLSLMQQLGAIPG